MPIGVGLLIGAGVAIASLFMAPDVDAAVALAVNGYWLLAGLLPFSLWLGILMTYDKEAHEESYNSLLATFATVIQAAMVGAGLGAGPLYLLVYSYLTAILRGFDAAFLVAALRNQLLWTPWAWVVVVSVIAALPLAYWAYRANVDRF